ncbi:MAG: nickel-dependent lactate racemase, partial [Bacillota bacterium]
ICLLVNDSTRVARSDFFLPILIDELKVAGIKKEDIFIIFTNGTHRPLDRDEMENLVGKDVAKNIAMFNHDSKDKNELVYLGETSFKTPVYVNKKALEADRRILTGSVVHHFFAGFGGGRKALIPGVAGFETIRKNHSLLLEDGSESGKLKGNPVHEDLLEAAFMVGCDFLLNTVLDENKQILGVFAGDMTKAHLKACDLVQKVNGVELDRLADVVIASCGGYPKDINVYQAHKTLDNCIRALKTGGKMVLLAECAEGIGSAAYEEWAVRYKTVEEVEAALRSNFMLGGHKAYTVAKLLERGDVYLVSSLQPDTAKMLGFIPARSFQDAIQEIYGVNKERFTYIVPQGSITFPLISD